MWLANNTHKKCELNTHECYIYRIININENTRLKKY